VDPAVVAEAWRKRCEQLTRPGPGGGTPCAPPDMDEKGFILRGAAGDVCNDPRAYVDADSGACIRTIEVSSFGRPNLKSLINFAFGHLGGPTFVLPSATPPPVHGPGPK